MMANTEIKIGDYNAAVHVDSDTSIRIIVRDPHGGMLFQVHRAIGSALGDEWHLLLKAHKRRVTALDPALPEDATTVILTAIIEYRELGLGAELQW